MIGESMKLDKKFIYDGTRIIKVKTKELYHFVYERIWDLTIYDQKLLESYGLKKAKYVYVGQSNEKNVNIRNSKWKYEVKNNRNIVKEIPIFIKKLERFYATETKYNNRQIDWLLYCNTKVIARTESKKSALKLEKYFTGIYHDLDFMGEILEQQIILLSKRDSAFREQGNSSMKVLKVR
jgi:hypothetical protein